MRRMLVSVALFFGLGQIAACGSDGGAGPKPIPPVLTTLTVTLSTSSVQVGQTAAASAAGLDQTGSAIGTGTLSWTSSSPAIAIVTSTGSITATSAGQTQIVASAGGRSAQATFTVTAIPVTTTVIVSLSSNTVVQGATVAATATPLDQNGAPLAGRTVSWSTGASAIASVSASGLVTGVAAGQTPVIATIDGKQGSLSVTVTPTPVAAVTVTPATVSLVIGGTQQLAATTVDANNNTLLGRVIAWTSSDSTKARVSLDGFVTAVATGTATITATSEGKSGTSAITVGSPPVASVTVTPASATIAVGGTQLFTATARDANGNVLTGRLFTWTSSNLSVVNGSFASNVLTGTGVGPGTATITATSEGKAGTAAVTVGSVPVATVTVTPATVSILVGGTQLLTATARDANGNTLTGRIFSWNSSNLGVVSGQFAANVLTALGVASGTATITATSEGKSGISVVTVSGGQQQACSSATAIQLAVGEIRTLTVAQIASLCLGGSGSASEYALIPFGNSAVAASTVQIQVTGTNTSTIVAPALGSVGPGLGRLLRPRSPTTGASSDWQFRERERRELRPLMAAFRGSRQVNRSRREQLTGIPTTPVVGVVYTLNADLGSSCGPKQLHPARAVAVLPHTIVFIDVQAPAGGYSDAELIAFGNAFDTLGFAIDTLNFGAPSDIDGNGRLGIFFTGGVNLIPGPPGGFVGGLFHGRDLFPATGVGSCAGSNEGEMFYMPVPDPNKTINGNYSNKAFLASGVLGTLVHEFQHLINASRRMYVNNVAAGEEVWLNEGLSHVAEELLYYRISGNSPRTNINASVIGSSQTQVAAYNAYLSNGNFQRLGSYLTATETNSPYSQVEGLEMRGAIWQLLRYASDRKGGTERNTWLALVNSATFGQANFNAVFGNMVAMTRDWAVAQFADDAGLAVASQYTNPSWNFRSIFPTDNNFGGVWPLATATWSLPSGTARVITLVGGGAAYMRFRVAASLFATVVSTSSGLPVPSSVDFILVRTQ